MSEKDSFLQTWEREYQTTVKVLKAYPADKLDFKPHQRSKSARQLAAAFANVEELLIGWVMKGQFEMPRLPESPETLKEILAAYERSHRILFERVKNLSEADFNKTMRLPVGPEQIGDMRYGDILWRVVMDQVHHRGQFSVYLRMAGGKVPSIYGPSADEPWM